MTDQELIHQIKNARFILGQYREMPTDLNMQLNEVVWKLSLGTATPEQRACGEEFVKAAQNFLERNKETLDAAEAEKISKLKEEHGIN
jgi:hypothetical protein